MRRPLPMALLALTLWIGRGGADEPKAADSKEESARATAATELAGKEAARYRIEPEDGANRPLTLETKPLLQWSNPVAGSIHGSVFVWTDRGRPAAVGSIYKWYSPNTHLGVELHSLAPGPLTASRDGRTVWTPSRGGVTFEPIPDAPTPADSAGGRLRQLRALAKEFAATETTREGLKRELRLLTQPVYRYESTDPDVIDGGLFAFVEGTDPEVLLLIEARRTPKGPRWQFAAARMNSIELKMSFQKREIWSAPVIPWEQARNHREPYSLFIYGSDKGIPGDGP